MSKFNYDPQHDTSIDVGETIVIQHKSLVISAGTRAGRAQPDSALKPNEDTFSIVSWEDGIAVAVFDGASSQKPIPELGDTSGARFASHELKRLFEATQNSEEAGVLLRGLNKALGERLRRFPSVDYGDLNSLPTSTATIVQINVATGMMHIGHVGDSFAAVLREDESTELLTNNLHRPYDEKTLQLLRSIAEAQGITPREARSDPRIRQTVMEMFQQTRNRPDGTGEGMVNGDPNMEQYIQTVTLSLKGVRAVLLGSDGLVPPGMDERRSTDRTALFQMALSAGISGLIEHTRAVEDDDPDRWKLRYKHADDATGILIQHPADV